MQRRRADRGRGGLGRSTRLGGKRGVAVTEPTIPLREHLTALIAAADVRYSERFQAQEKAILKAELASEKRFEG
jgi:hypothetical protein